MVKLSLLLVFSALTSIVVAAFTVLMVLGQYYDDVFFRRTAALGVGPEGVCRAVPDGPYKIKMYFSSEKKQLTVFFAAGSTSIPPTFHTSEGVTFPKDGILECFLREFVWVGRPTPQNRHTLSRIQQLYKYKKASAE